jgi:hypothetical protein
MLGSLRHLPVSCGRSESCLEYDERVNDGLHIPLVEIQLHELVFVNANTMFFLRSVQRYPTTCSSLQQPSRLVASIKVSANLVDQIGEPCKLQTGLSKAHPTTTISTTSKIWPPQRYVFSDANDQ